MTETTPNPSDDIFNEFIKQTDKTPMPEIETILKQIATNSIVENTWELLKQYLAYRISTVINEYTLKYHSSRSEEEIQGDIDLITKRVMAYQFVPFTIQRICEVILNPDEYYKDIESVISAFNKLTIVHIENNNSIQDSSAMEEDEDNEDSSALPQIPVVPVASMDNGMIQTVMPKSS